MVLASSPNDLDLIVRAAWLYHGDGLTQAQVAKRLFVSRQTVGRLLEAARAQGVVRIEIDARCLAALDLATRLRDTFGLSDAIVVPRDDDTPKPTGRVNERVAAALAAYVRRYLHPGAVVGVGWGDTVAKALSMLSEESLEGVTLASAAGSIQAISQSLAGEPKVAHHLRVVPAPLLVSSPEAATMLRAEQTVREVLELASTASVTLTGIGAAGPGASAVRSQLLTEAEVASYAGMGAVGDMLGEWFDAHGRIVSEATSNRRIGLSLDQLRAMPNVVAVAGGREKAEAVLGAIRGGYLKVLVTDETTAEELLAKGSVTAGAVRAASRPRPAGEATRR
ncbi:MAG TPA: sugar-binding transcriptional regulator [Propionicimonas sp.]|uniref:sugar-binding transcriptional regulator n=1 Tax=Propionicimonas sp. TaxID=1955623 RepID=UPI002F424980